MSATVAVLGTSVFNTTAGNKTITATPTVGDLIVIITSATGVASSVADNGTGGTYTKVDSTRTGFSTSGNLEMWVRNSLVSSASSTVYTATQTSSTGGGLVILRITGMNLAGAAAVRSSGGQNSGTAATTPAPVLSLTPLSSNPIITAVSNGATAASITPRTGYTEDFDNGYSTPSTGLEVSHLASGETSATITYGAASTTAFASIAIELQYNTAPTVALNSPADTATGISTTPDLTFTGTDADSNTIEYEVQVDTVSTFDSGTIDSYSETNADASATTGSINFVTKGVAQTFTGNGSSIQSATLYLKTVGSPTGTMTAKIYAITGVYGSTAAPTGTALASSTGLSVPNTLSSNFSLITFQFPTPYTTTAATNYALALEVPTGTDASNTVIWGSDITSPTHSGNFGGNLQSGSWFSASSSFDLCFYVFSSTSHLAKFSAIPDATFTDVTNGANTHPFPSGEQIKYTVQSANILTASTTYYWRVIAKDPTGTNNYGSYATTRSFTTSSGLTNSSITQVAASVTATGGTQVVVANISTAVTQLAATVTATGGTQTAASVRNVSIAQVAGTVTASGGTQTIATVNNSSVTQLAANVTSTGGTQTVAASQFTAITQSAANVTATGNTQSVATINNVSITQLAANVVSSGGTQVITAATSASVTQTAATVTASGGTQTVSASINASVAQLAATVTASGGTQTVASVEFASVAQSAATVTANGGTQAVVTTQSVAITQLAGSVTATGGTQTVASAQLVSITQVAANATATGGTQTVSSINNVSIIQLAASVTASGGTQAVSATVIASSSITQVAATVTATGGTQSLATVQNATIAQSAASVTATGGTQAIAITASIAQSAASVTTTGSTQSLSTSQFVSLAQSAGSVTANGGTQTVATTRFVAITQTAATVTASGGTQSIGSVISATVNQIGAAVTVNGGTQSIVSQPFVNVALTQIAGFVTAAGGTQTIAAGAITGGTVKVWNGSSWDVVAPKVYNGATYDTAVVKVRSGSSWIETLS
jgi:hypothetical protein